MDMLSKLEKTNYSYIMLKPDSRERINDIIDDINRHLFKIVELYYLNPFFDKALISYENKKGNYNYYQAIKAHLLLSSFYFGNHGLLAILDINDKMSLESFKKEIRRKYTLGENNSSQMLVNLNCFPNLNHDVPSGDLYVKEKNNYIPIPFYKELNGKWSVATLNMLHAPDNYEEYLNDIKNYYQSGVFCEENIVSDGDLALIKKYKTYERIR
jgi:nucleoside diphosphate kinase